MSILTVILVIVVVGVLLWAIKTYLPLDPPIKTLLSVVVIGCLVIWLLSVFGIFGAVDTVRVPRAD